MKDAYYELRDRPENAEALDVPDTAKLIQSGTMSPAEHVQDLRASVEVVKRPV